MTPNPTLSSAPLGPIRRALCRRDLLRGVGIALSLPLLDAMVPAFARAAPPGPLLARPGRPRRFFAICNNLGLLPQLFFPTSAGRAYALSPYLEVLKDHRNDFTVFSGLSHPDVDGSHASEACFLTAAPHPLSSSFRNTISLDQAIAEQIGTLTRFPSLTMGVNTRGRGLSWTASGVAIPCEDKASEVFKQLFLQGTPDEIAVQVRRLNTGRSVLDAVAAQTKRLARQVGAHDRERLDQYLTSVRDLEGRMHAALAWEEKPKPVVTAAPPVDPESPADFVAKVKVMYDLARLAFQTDSTRIITLALDGVSSPVLNLAGAKITEGYHNLSHHGKSPDKLQQLEAIERWHMKLLAGLIADFKSVTEADGSLLDRTMVLYGSNLGDANSHKTNNLPTLLAGGGFRHGQHLAFDTKNNYPLPNLYVSLMQRMGLPATKFASSTGSMRGLELT